MSVLDNPDYAETLRQATALWGEKFQQEMAVEECAELITSLRHFDRGRTGVMDLLEEVADVTIIVAQLTQDHNAEKVVDSIIIEKMRRLQLRIDKNAPNLKNLEPTESQVTAMPQRPDCFGRGDSKTQLTRRVRFCSACWYDAECAEVDGV